MKTFIVLAFLSFNAFAGSYIKTDEGQVEWKLNIKEMTGSVVASRSSINTERINLAYEDFLRASGGLGLFFNVGEIINETVTFDIADERSQDVIKDMLRIKFEGESQNPSTDISSSNVELSRLQCKEKGIFKKELICSAKFISTMEIQVIDSEDCPESL